MISKTYEHNTVVDALSEESESAYQKYIKMYVGKDSLIGVLKYELITLLFSSFPGALGFVLRKKLYKGLFSRIGRGAIFGPNLTLRCPGQMIIGNNFVADGNVVMDAKGNESFIETGDAIFVGKNTIFSCSSSSIKLGDEVSIGPDSYIRASRGPVTLGSFVTIGAQTVIISGNPDYKRLDIPMMKQEGSSMGIVIGDDVWIGVGVRIIDGVKIGDGCVIGAGAVVTKDIPDYSIAAGVPAKVLANRK